MALTDNLTEYYSMNGNSNDATATANNGTDSNITYSSANGIIPNGAGFNGTTSKIVLGTAIACPTNVSLQAWVKGGDTNTRMIFSDSNAIQTIGWGLWINSGTVTFFLWLDATHQVQWSSTGAEITSGAWHHIVVTQAGVAKPIIYVDGAAITLNSPTSVLSKPAAQGTEIGKWANVSSNWWNGAIDEVGIWTRVLSSSEVTQLYNSGAGLAYPLVVNVTVNSPLATLNILGNLPTVNQSLSIPRATMNIQGMPLTFQEIINLPIATENIQAIVPVVSVLFSLPVSSANIQALSATLHLVGAGVINLIKHSASATNQSKHSASATNQSKNASTWVNQSKN